MRVSVGCDPEFQLVLDGKYVSAHDVVPGTKKDPRPLNKGAVQADGAAVEFNIEPAFTKEEFVSNINTVMAQVRELIPDKYAFSFYPAIEFTKEYWDTLPEMVKQIGCDPSFASYNWRQPLPAPRRPGTLACFGGHLHIGWGQGYDPNDDSHREDCATAARRFHDLVAQYLQDFSANKGRNQMYGIYHDFRPKSYGVEVRELSCEWLAKPEVWPWLFDMCQFTIRTITEPIINKYVDQYRYGLYDTTGKKRLENCNRYMQAVWGKDFPEYPIQ